METVYIAGGCLWGVQAFIKTLPGVLSTEAGRANGISETLSDKYDGYAECVKTTFDPMQTSITDLMNYLFEIIDPYSINKQGVDEGPNIVQVFIVMNRSILKKHATSSQNDLIKSELP